MQRQKDALLAKISMIQASVHALDRSIRLVESSVQPGAAGVIHRHCEKYGKRGAFREFVLSAIRGSANGITANTLALQACGHFQLEITNAGEMYSFIENSLRPQLKRLRREGLVESLPSPNRRELLWRWKEQLPSLAELAAQSCAPLVGGPDENQDKVRGEVAGE